MSRIWASLVAFCCVRAGFALSCAASDFGSFFVNCSELVTACCSVLEYVLGNVAPEIVLELPDAGLEMRISFRRESWICPADGKSSGEIEAAIAATTDPYLAKKPPKTAVFLIFTGHSDRWKWQ